MSKSTFASSLMAVILLLAVVPYHRVATAEGFDWAALAAAEASAEAGETEPDQETQAREEERQQFCPGSGSTVPRTRPPLWWRQKENEQSASREDRVLKKQRRSRPQR